MAVLNTEHIISVIVNFILVCSLDLVIKVRAPSSNCTNPNKLLKPEKHLFSGSTVNHLKRFGHIVGSTIQLYQGCIQISDCIDVKINIVN